MIWNFHDDFVGVSMETFSIFIIKGWCDDGDNVWNIRY